MIFKHLNILSESTYNIQMTQMNKLDLFRNKQGNNMNILGICYECSVNMMQTCSLHYIASILNGHSQNVPQKERATFLYNYMIFPSS